MLAMLLTLAQSDAEWFPFMPKNDVGPSVVGMNSWSDGPLTKDRGIRIKGDRLILANGKPIKLWGVNNANINATPSHAAAEFRASRFAKFGINAVRLHKFTYKDPGGGIGDPNDSTKLTAEGWDRLDYFTAELAKRGIYHGWSHIYGHEPRDVDRSRVLAFDEAVKANDGFLKGSDYGLVNVAPDLQDLHIALTVNMLRHRNPYTGRTYAEDPGLAFVEFQNEDDIFFPTTQAAVLRSPTYKKALEERFSAWLVRKYQDDAGLRAAWGPKALNAWPEFQDDESLAKRNVYPICHHWWYTHEGVANQTANKLGGNPRRLYDMAAFLHEEQNAFYGRFVKAVRATGYRGPLVGSCWQAGDNLGHYYNLRSDALVGLVDRHNYFGGQDSPMKVGPLHSASMLREPGSGILSTGMQQVARHPFALSEWTTVVPNEWTAEAAPIIAAYGMGLQGWDASYAFANDYDRFSETMAIRGGWGVWNIDLPTHLGLYPALARMVRRGDVKEGPVVAVRRVSLEDLRQGKAPADDVSQTGDRKAFGGAEALALGRVVVDFDGKTPKPAKQVPPDTSKIVSATGQLAWLREKGAAYFTIDTAGTAGVGGYTTGSSIVAGPIDVRLETSFAVVLLSALDAGSTLKSSRSLLLTAVARCKNTGQRYSEDGRQLLAVGTAPLLLEPVRAGIKVDRKGLRAVNVLDQDGRRTGKTVPVENGTIAIDTGRDRTLYYELVYDAKEPLARQ